ncbi:MAG: T9SS type A sorting domain-containing protein, partial [Candidatus Electryoneaceae bacterium]|nr:T9SS type A sorting domain-containing protein [Candidatus Electryoneaceae bacterium]
FDLVAPDNDAFINAGMNEISFTWEASGNVDYEDDAITYAVVFYVDGSGDSTVVGDLETNEYPDRNVDAMLAELELDDEVSHEFVWVVWAYDPETGTRSSTERAFTVEERLGVAGDDYGLPIEYFMSGNYPNPFNQSTKINFALPQSASVQLTVWDMHGRKVSVLADGTFAAGRYEAVWTAQGMTSGVYFIRIQANGYHAMQKAILLR